MSMHDKLCRSVAIGALAMGAAVMPAMAQDAESRTVAALPAEIPETTELMPASPVADSEGTDNPGLDANFGLGREATEDEIAAIDIDIMPDGHGLPEGSGSYAEGSAIYDEKCALCHGENLEGVAELGGPALIGGRDTLASDRPVKTVESYLAHASTLYDYIHRAMPLDMPGSLEPDEVYALSAYILGRGGIIGEDAELDAESLAAVQMPNADGFVEDPRPNAH